MTAYLAPEGHTDELTRELGAVSEACGRLVLADGPERPAAWVANVWHDPVRIGISSIADGARQLRNLQRNWALYSFRLHRRAGLLQALLPKVSAKPL